MALDRRKTDNVDDLDEISEMIKQENDPKIRLQLMVLYNINLSLIANTETVNDIDTQLKTHLEEYSKRTATEEALINRGKGAWKVLAWVGGFAQAGILALAFNTLSELKVLHLSDSMLAERVIIIEQKLK